METMARWRQESLSLPRWSYLFEPVAPVVQLPVAPVVQLPVAPVVQLVTSKPSDVGT